MSCSTRTSPAPPNSSLSEAWEEIEEKLSHIAEIHELDLKQTFDDLAHALPDWRRRLALRVAAHDLALAGQRTGLWTSTASSTRAPDQPKGEASGADDA